MHKIGNAQQMLLDLVTAVSKSKTITDPDKQAWMSKIADLADNLPKEALDEANRIFDSRNYKNVSFAMTPTIKEDPAIASLLDLPPAEMQILVLFERLAVSQFIRMSRSQIEDITKLSASAIKRAVKGLLSKKIILVEVEATSKTPAIYKINSTILRSGKNKTLLSDKEAFDAANQKSEYAALFSKKYKVETCTYTHDDGRVFMYAAPEIRESWQ